MILPFITLTRIAVAVLLASVTLAHIAIAAEDPAPPLATLTLVTPNGGEGWTFNSRRRIDWTSTDLTGNIRVEVSRDAGATWTVVIASTANVGSFNWMVTPPATTRARIRVCSVTTPTLCDISDRNFRIAAAVVTVVTPNGGEAWVPDTTRTIQWTSAGAVGSNVRVELSRDAGATWTPIFASIGNDGGQGWLVTGPLTNLARVRVCSVSAPTVCDVSDGNFRITSGALEVVTPDGGEAWEIGSTRRIAWTSSGDIGSDVRIDLSRNGGASWTRLFASAVNDRAQDWVVTGPVTTDARIRVCRTTSPFRCDISDASFAITSGSVRVLSPNGGQRWPVGGTRRIEWTSSVPGNVRIEVSRDGGASWTTIFASIGDDGAQDWTVTGPVTGAARIRVCSVNVPTACDTSDANFAIVQTADLTVTQLSFTPTDILGGQSWLVRVRTRNDGLANAAASRTDILIGPTSATGTIRLMSFDVPALAPGAVNEQDDVIAFPFTVPPDTYFVFARVDATGVVPEGDEDNEFVLVTPTLLVH
jgi:hypothetical protein